MAWSRPTFREEMAGNNVLLDAWSVFCKSAWGLSTLEHLPIQKNFYVFDSESGWKKVDGPSSDTEDRLSVTLTKLVGYDFTQYLDMFIQIPRKKTDVSSHPDYYAQKKIQDQLAELAYKQVVQFLQDHVLSRDLNDLPLALRTDDFHFRNEQFGCKCKKRQYILFNGPGKNFTTFTIVDTARKYKYCTRNIRFRVNHNREFAETVGDLAVDHDLTRMGKKPKKLIIGKAMQQSPFSELKWFSIRLQRSKSRVVAELDSRRFKNSLPMDQLNVFFHGKTTKGISSRDLLNLMVEWLEQGDSCLEKYNETTLGSEISAPYGIIQQTSCAQCGKPIP